MHISSKLMVQIKQKGVYGVKTPLPRSALGVDRVMFQSCSVAEQNNGPVCIIAAVQEQCVSQSNV